MKRTGKIRVTDGSNSVELTVSLETVALMRHESQRALDHIMGAIMELLPRVPYTDFKLVRMKVK